MNRVSPTLLKSKTQYNSYLYFDSIFYKHLDNKTFKKIIKPHLFTTINQFKDYNSNLKKLNYFYNKVARRNFYVSLEELLIDIFEMYEWFFTQKSIEMMWNEPGYRQIEIIWGRLVLIKELIGDGIDFTEIVKYGKQNGGMREC